MSRGRDDRPSIALLVGGASRRMGRPKGAIASPEGPTLLERLVAIAKPLGDVVLVGNAEPYATIVPEIPRIADAAEGAGPLGGLVAALEHGASRFLVVLACDLPYAGRAAIETLLDAPADRPVVAYRAAKDAPFEPLFARYERARTLPAARAALERGELSLQRLLAAIGVTPLAPRDPRALRDWDTPGDVEDDLGRTR